MIRFVLLCIAGVGFLLAAIGLWTLVREDPKNIPECCASAGLTAVGVLIIAAAMGIRSLF